MNNTVTRGQLPGKGKFNVLHVVSRLPVGGVENMLLKVVQRYDRDRFNVSICCIKEGGEIADVLRGLGYRVEVLGRMQGHGIDWGAVAALRRVLKQGDIHILRTHQYHANFYGRIAAVLAGVPVVIPSFHSSYSSPSEPKLHRRIFNFLLSFFSDALVAVSPSVLSGIVQYDRVKKEKIRVIYNGIRMDDFIPRMPRTECRKELNLPDSELIIGSVGRLKEEKGHRFLIEAAAGLENVCIALAGDGQLLNHLRDAAERHGVKCIFLGMLPPERIPVFLGALDVFCFPSLWEGFPSAVIEAMAAGLPVVASGIPSVREIVGDSGILVDAGDPKMLAPRLKALRDDAALRRELGEKAVAQVQKFSIENTVMAYQDLFEEMLERKGLYA